MLIKHCYGRQARTAAVSCSAFHVQGSRRSSSWALVRPETTRSSTSVSHARGSTPFSFAVATRLATIAQWQAPPSDPANKAFLRPRLIGRIARSTVLVCVPCPKVPRLGGFDPHPAALAPAGSTPDGSGGDEWPEASGEKASSGGQRTARAATRVNTEQASKRRRGSRPATQTGKADAARGSERDAHPAVPPG